MKVKYIQTRCFSSNSISRAHKEANEFLRTISHMKVRDILTTSSINMFTVTVVYSVWGEE